MRQKIDKEASRRLASERGKKFPSISDTRLNHDESWNSSSKQNNNIHTAGIYHIIDAIENHNNVWLSPLRSSIMHDQQKRASEVATEFITNEGSFPLIVNSHQPGTNSFRMFVNDRIIDFLKKIP